MAVGVDEYAQQLAQLLPRGILAATAERAGSNLRLLLEAFAEGLFGSHERAAALLDELDPRLTLEALADWEQELDIPGPCGVLGTTVDARRQAIIEKLTDPGGQSVARLLEIAARFGHPSAEIEEYQYTHIGDEIGDSIYGPEWVFAFTLRTTEDLAIVEAAIGSQIGEALRTWGNELLECAIEHAKPAHTTAVFAYGSI